MGQTIIQRGAGGGGGSGYSTVQDEGSALTARTTINFVGQGVIADDSGAVTRVRIEDLASQLTLVDDFMSGSSGAAQLGSLGWTPAGGTVTLQAAEAGRPGLVRQSTTTTSGTNCRVVLTNTSGTACLVPSDTFDARWSLRPNQSDANTSVRVGFLDSNSGNPPTNGIYVERLDADTNWFGVCRSGGVQTRVDLGVAFAAAWFRLRMRRKDGSTISFSVDGGAESDVTTNIPTAGLLGVTQIINSAASAKTMDLDYFALGVSGLSR